MTDRNRANRAILDLMKLSLVDQTGGWLTPARLSLTEEMYQCYIQIERKHNANGSKQSPTFQKFKKRKTQWNTNYQWSATTQPLRTCGQSAILPEWILSLKDTPSWGIWPERVIRKWGICYW